MGLQVAQIDHTFQSLPSLIDRASSALMGARTAAEVLEAKGLASLAYDVAKKVARFQKAKNAHDTLIAATHRAQADALEIEAGAKRRLADEYDAAQARGEVATATDKLRQGPVVPKENDGKPTAAELGFHSRTEIHEARIIRDAEKAEPGIIKRTLAACLANGEEPSKTALRQAVIEAAGPRQSKEGSGYRVRVPDGMTMEQWTRQGLASEAAGRSINDIALDFGIARTSYRAMRDIVLLSDRTDLRDGDRRTAEAALHELNETRRIAKPYELVARVVERLWGGRGGHQPGRSEKRVAQRVEQFEDAVCTIVQICTCAVDLEIPYLGREKAKVIIEQIEEACASLKALKKRMEEICG